MKQNIFLFKAVRDGRKTIYYSIFFNGRLTTCMIEKRRSMGSDRYVVEDLDKTWSSQPTLGEAKQYVERFADRIFNTAKA